MPLTLYQGLILICLNWLGITEWPTPHQLLVINPLSAWTGSKFAYHEVDHLAHLL